MAGTQYMLFRRARDYLRGHPDATDEEVAAAAGIKLAFREEARLVGEARKQLAADRGEVHDLNRGTGVHGYVQGTL